MGITVLFVEDEDGIREGLASFLRLKGCHVETAASCAEGLSKLAAQDFDLVVTDWHLGDGLGKSIIQACSCPVLVASGVPEEVGKGLGDNDQQIEIIRKPMLPTDLLGRIQELAAVQSPPPVDLPQDAKDRVALLRCLASDPNKLQIHDDGSMLCIEAPLRADWEDLLPCLGSIGGDLRVLDREGESWLEQRFYKNGCPDGVNLLVSPTQAWPAGEEPLAVDFHSSEISLLDFQKAVATAQKHNGSGRDVYFLNVPHYLRMFMEISGKPHDMPKRGVVGPRLPELLAELWK